jgi:drug/metabolite transporter (DMT)-like permease
MPLTVFLFVILAAVLHAGWNAIVKSASDKFLTAILVATSAAIISAVALPFLAQPAAASLPYAAASASFEVIYFVLLARAYQVADMSHVYPLMRGTAPLLVALVTVFQFGQDLSSMAWLGVIAVCAGILTVAVGRMEDRRGIPMALLNAVVIACYTLIDGIGVRRSGAPAAYTLWVTLLSGLPLSTWVMLRRRSRFIPYLIRHWRIGSIGGLSTIVSYGVALWAMTLVPVAIVAALRETSILFGTLIAGVVLKENIGPKRIISACIIAGGAIALRLA